MIQITAPAESPVDESIAISVSGLKPKQRVTISCDATRHDVTMSSFANYEASDSGEVDLTRDRSLGGTYFGKEPMGLFWSMEVTSKIKIAFKMLNGRLTSWPCQIRISDGHPRTFEELRKLEPLAEREIQRTFLSDGIRRSDVRYQTLRGFLFLPNPDTAPGPYPAVIDIYASSHLVAHRAAMFARHGFAVLAVAYGGYEDLPPRPDCMDMGYFAQAYDYLKNHVPEVDGNRIGIQGNCLGGILSLSLAREIPGIRAVVAASPPPIAEQLNYLFPSDGELVKGVPLCTENYEDNGIPFKRLLTEKAVIQATGSLDAWRQFSVSYGRIKDAPVLMFFGGDDKFLDLNFAIPLIRQQFADRKKENYEIVFYKGAGHILQPCYLPLYDRYFSPLFEGMVYYGGQLPDHARAQSDMWCRTLAFFKSHLKDMHLDDYAGPRPVNVRRGSDGKIIDSSDVNCQFNVVDFDEKQSSAAI